MHCPTQGRNSRDENEMPAKTLVIIPAYNEQKSLPGVIADLREHAPDADVVVVDDGSWDATARVAEECGVTVLRLPFNLGIGGAMQTGYRFADRHGYAVAVQFDGDGQHLAAEIAPLLTELGSGAADIVVGSRFLLKTDYQSPFFRRIGIWIFSKVLSRILGMPMTDTTSGFRAANREELGFVAGGYPDDYPEVESLVLLHKAGLRIAEVPVKMRARSEGKSSITPLRSVYYMVKVLLAVLIDLMKRVR
jgi:glycosyltransferase involved in cell wall biosynthesis